MKMKLLIIGILALLLCAMVPMSVAAVKDKTAITYPVYKIKGSAPTAVVGERVGKITFNPENGVYSLSCNGLVSGQRYCIALTDKAPGEGGSLFGVGFYNISPGFTSVQAEHHHIRIAEATAPSYTWDLPAQGSVFCLTAPP
jgi:hypothetical protein